jgi:hypothetical protein
VIAVEQYIVAHGAYPRRWGDPPKQHAVVLGSSRKYPRVVGYVATSLCGTTVRHGSPSSTFKPDTSRSNICKRCARIVRLHSERSSS